MHFLVNNRRVEADGEGFLVNPSEWNEEVARLVALHDGITLTDTHWGLVAYFRHYYQENQRVPSMNKLVMTLGRHHGPAFSDRKVYEKFLYDLFPRGPVQTLARLSGLPRPQGDLDN
jgi:tRNA 2-thiouridine synthesizing protein E